MLNMLNLAYQSNMLILTYHMVQEIMFTVQDTVKTMCNIDIGSRNKMRSTADNIGGTLLRKIFG